MTAKIESAGCQVCGSEKLREVESFSSLPRITSDCCPFPSGGRLFVCDSCGGVQKNPDAKWLAETKSIYSRYAPYYQSAGREQMVFDRSKGMGRRRSDVLLERLMAGNAFKQTGCVLDVGCGNGVMLSAMSRGLQGWALYGYELDDGGMENFLKIPGFVKLYKGALNSIDRSFDVVTLVHVLEHFPAPLEALRSLRRIVEGGKIFVEVCHLDENPFDLLVADHLMHFTPVTLVQMLRSAGFENIAIATDWIPKEISLLAETDKINGLHPVFPGDWDGTHSKEIFVRMTNYVAWLHKIRREAEELSRRNGSMGIFGTSIAGTWLASALGKRVRFFVDEDRERIGRNHLGMPVLHPSEIPAGSVVFFALAPILARTVRSRIVSNQFESVLPPPLEVI